MILSAFAFVLGCFLIALSLVMFATKAGYVFFVIGPRTVLYLAIAIGVLAASFRLLSAA